MFSKNKLKELIRLAESLGFTDDIAHWQAELDKLEGSTDGRRED